MIFRNYCILLFLMLFASPVLTFATHNRAGEITYSYINGLTYELTITTFTKTTGSEPDRANLDLSIYSYNSISNTWSLVTTLNVNRTSFINPTPVIRKNKYVTTYTFPGQGTYRLGMQDPNRNDGVKNIPNSVNQNFYIETQLQINFQFGVNTSPVLLLDPIDTGALNKLFVHNPAAFDADGDSLVFSLIPCQDGINSPISGFVSPELSCSSGPASFTIDRFTGEIRWNTPKCLGEYNIAILIEEYRRVPPRTSRIKIGYVIRDMQITIVNSTNNPPVIAAIADTCIIAGASISKIIRASDPDAGQIVHLTATGAPFQIIPTATFTPIVDNANPVSSTFTWNTNCNTIRQLPYQVIFRAEDDVLSGSKPSPTLVDLKTYNIRVIAPAITNLKVVSKFGKNDLSWDIHSCTNAKGYRVYRRTGCDTWTPSVCETGVPNGLGYTLITTITGRTNTTFTDDNGGAGFNFGGTYAYHVVAYFEETVTGTSTTYIASESIASNKQCITIKRDIPVITNASVIVTDSLTGTLLVRWRRPDTLNAKLPVGTIRYNIYQGVGTNPTTYNLVGTNTLGINDTTFTVTNLNTKTTGYAYRIEYFVFNSSLPDVKVATSVAASSPYLSGTPLHRAVNLGVSFVTPWQEDTFYVYRSVNFAGPYTLIATLTNPTYKDTGLQPRKPYYYYITTSGAYYNTSEIKRPLLNNSQILKLVPKDTIAPCSPNLSGNLDCSTQTYSFVWNVPDNTACGDADDNLLFNMYFKRYLDSPYQQIGTFTRNELSTQTTFSQYGLTGCYYVTAVDSSGNESKPSPEACFDNPCVELEMPNIFTPSNIDNINAVFKPKRYKYIDAINVRIYNRWGVELNQSNNPVNLWDGKNNSLDVPEGVYYYEGIAKIQRLRGVEDKKLIGNVTLMR